VSVRSRRAVAALAVLLFVSTVAVFWQVGEFDFVGYDDRAYITDNPAVQDGWTAESVTWAFTTSHLANWDPLTWLTHMLDWQLYGDAAGGHHRTNLWLHALNGVLLFLLLVRMTGRTGPSAFVAYVFALHPLHVEAVAWVAARKDVLSTLFWILTTWAYVRYVRSPGRTRYAVVAGLFALGLMSKPMLVTLPFTLLLLDAWPLDRLGKGERARRLVLEKLPLLALAAATSLVTYAVQASAGAVESLRASPLADRAANAVVSYAFYVVKTLWPCGLGTPYPYVEDLPLAVVAASALLLVGVTAAAVVTRRSRPYLLVGWLWFLGTLVPVIGLVQIGAHARADRFTYVPMIGLLVMFAWWVGSLVPAGRTGRRVTALAAAAAVAAYAVATYAQLGHWRNTETLCRRALAVTADNKVAHYNLALYLDRDGRGEEAVEHYREALRIRPGDFDARWNLGNTLMRQQRFDEAAEQFRRILEVSPDSVEPMTKLAAILTAYPDPAGGDLAESVRLAERAAELSGRSDPMVLSVLAAAYDAAGERERAVETICVALALARSAGQASLVSRLEERLRGASCPAD
jgi:tetratricopeptide (TPR) repeat protein